jgi:DNA uptake protein ComE-like DNA-binding protein
MENGAVTMRMRVALLAVVMTGCCVWASAQGRDTQDRDSRGVPATTAKAPAPADRVDINHASLDELMTIPGLTRVWAARIVRYRPYRTKAELLDQGIVTADVYERIKDYVIAHRNQ